MTARSEVPDDIVMRLRAMCLAMPGAREESAWTGTRWRIGTKTFAHVVAITDGWPPAYARAAGMDDAVVLTFRAAEPDLSALAQAGPPFFKPVWFTDILGVELNAHTDWDVVAELVMDSHRHLAPRRTLRETEREVGSGSASDNT